MAAGSSPAGAGLLGHGTRLLDEASDVFLLFLRANCRVGAKVLFGLHMGTTRDNLGCSCIDSFVRCPMGNRILWEPEFGYQIGYSA